MSDATKQGTTHLSDSRVQRDLELVALQRLSERLGVELERDVQIALGAGYVVVDGADAGRTVLVEIFGHIGKLLSAQKHKVSTDILKLTALAADRPNARLILAFVDEIARASLTGWRREVLARNGIEAITIDVGDELRGAVRAAQAQQAQGLRGAQAK